MLPVARLAQGAPFMRRPWGQLPVEVVPGFREFIDWELAARRSTERSERG